VTATRAPEDVEVGRRLRDIRKSRDLTQAELGRLLGLHQSLIAQYEGGYIRLYASLIVRLCRALRATPNELLGFQEFRAEQLTRNRRLLPRLKRVDELQPADQRALLRFLDALLSRGHDEPASAPVTRARPVRSTTRRIA
jgi:transcriptional regulator with XRE-family HTH domain